MPIHKVLLIDDNADTRMIVRMALEMFGQWTVIEARTGEEGLRVADLEQPDLILLDVNMPVLDGPGTLSRLRAQANNASVPVVFITARAKPHDFVQSGSAGVITKPFNPLELSAEIRRLVDANEGAGTPPELRPAARTRVDS